MYTYNDYTAVSPSNWNELTYQDNNDTQIMSYMNSEIEDISINMEKSAVSSRELSQNLSESANHIAAFAENVDGIRKMVQQANENAQVTSVMAKENRKNALNEIRILQDKMQMAHKDIQKIEQVKQIAEEIGKILNKSVQEVASVTTNNAYELFDLR